ncbi:DTW domain containing protein [Klebsormidium nitens]|uniref:tRNA-uridine aminocarboxypropyltransferase n=1 Tax=Klebsormidium nitens TaxID=105231 RepID=A0A1Y1HQI0_KLENI|nr:DTW domain containing protein [Klebsormidium nitens]|eukprot:GAQ80333.1 DTW domain containing protein [Klebsormidium nitens]
METTALLSTDGLRRTLMEGNSAGRLRQSEGESVVLRDGRQLGNLKVARSFRVDAPSSLDGASALDQAFEPGQVTGLQTSSLEQSKEAPGSVMDRADGAVGSESTESSRLLGRASHIGASTSTESFSLLTGNNSSSVENASPLRVIDSVLADSVPLLNRDMASQSESSPTSQLDRRRSQTLTNRILRGAIELKAVVSSSSPLAKTKESKKELAEQRSKKRKEGTIEFATGERSYLESVSAEDVAQSLEKLEGGALTELRIVNEDAFKEHMAFLRDPEQKQRVSTYRTLAGRILSEYLTRSETPPTQATKPSPNPSQTRSFNPSDQSRAPSNEAAKPSDHQSLSALNQTRTPSDQLLTPSKQGPKPTVQCTECWLPQESCMCQEVFRFSRPLWPGMRIWMLMHPKEYRRKNNTGKVLWQLFGEESVRLSISGLDILENEMWGEFAAAGPGRVFLMYPERKAQETMEIFYIDTLPLPSTSPHASPNPTSGACDTPTTNPEALIHTPRVASPSGKSPASQTLRDSPLEGPETSPAHNPPKLFVNLPNRQRAPSVQNPEASHTPQTSQTPPVSVVNSPPVHFVFLDGTWNNSTAMLVRLQEQAERVWGRKMACLCLTPDSPSKMHSLRPQPALEKVCTAAAASTLLRELSERPELSAAGLSDAADTVDHGLEVLVKFLQGWRARVGRSPTRGPNRTPAENWVPRERSRSRSPVSECR